MSRILKIGEPQITQGFFCRHKAVDFTEIVTLIKQNNTPIEPTEEPKELI